LFRSARGGDRRARDELIEAYLPLARQLARRYSTPSESLEDLEQVACLALVRAVDAFDVERGTAFSSYAVPCIAGAVKRYFRDYGWAVRVPRRLQELALSTERFDEKCFADTGRHATAAELADAVGAGVEEVLEAREAHRARYSESLQRTRGPDDEEDVTLLDGVADPRADFERSLERMTLDEVLAELDDRDRTIVELYYREELTQTEIGGRLGYSQMHISRRLRAAVRQLQARTARDSPEILTRAA
jgi:RNA polymerase sigma-B factor